MGGPPFFAPSGVGKKCNEPPSQPIPPGPPSPPPRAPGCPSLAGPLFFDPAGPDETRPPWPPCFFLEFAAPAAAAAGKTLGLKASADCIVRPSGARRHPDLPRWVTRDLTSIPQLARLGQRARNLDKLPLWAPTWVGQQLPLGGRQADRERARELVGVMGARARLGGEPGREASSA